MKKFVFCSLLALLLILCNISCTKPLNDEEKSLIGEWYRAERIDDSDEANYYPRSFVEEYSLEYKNNKTYLQNGTLTIREVHDDEDYVVTVIYDVVIKGIWSIDDGFLETNNHRVQINYSRGYITRSHQKSNYLVEDLKERIDEVVPELKSYMLGEHSDEIVLFLPNEISLVDEEGETYSMKRL